MRQVILGAALACLVALSAAVRADPAVPPALAAKRAGVVSQATPSRPDLLYTALTPCTAFGTARTTKVTAGK